MMKNTKYTLLNFKYVSHNRAKKANTYLINDKILLEMPQGMLKKSCKKLLIMTNHIYSGHIAEAAVDELNTVYFYLRLEASLAYIGQSETPEEAVFKVKLDRISKYRKILEQFQTYRMIDVIWPEDETPTSTKPISDMTHKLNLYQT